MYTVSKVRIRLTSAKVLQLGELERGAHVDPCPHDLHHNQVTSQQSHQQQRSLRVSLAWLPLESRDELGEGLGDRDPVFDSPDTQGVIDSSSCTHLIALLGETELAVELFCWRKSGKRDKPTIPNTLTTVGVWNGKIFYLAPISPKFRHPPK